MKPQHIIPPRGVSIRAGHPLARGLLFAFYPQFLTTVADGIVWGDSARTRETDNLTVDITGSAWVLDPGNSKIGQAIDATGTTNGDDYMRSPQYFSQYEGGATLGLTFVQWIKPPANVYNGYPNPLGIFPWDSINDRAQLFFDGGYGEGWDASKFKFRYRSNSGIPAFSFSGLSAGVWACVAATLTAAGNVNLYVDGHNILSTSDNPMDTQTRNCHLFIGSGGTTTGDSAWDGHFGPSLGWDRPLSPGELQAINRDPYALFKPLWLEPYLPAPGVLSIIRDRRL